MTAAPPALELLPRNDISCQWALTRRRGEGERGTTKRKEERETSSSSPGCSSNSSMKQHAAPTSSKTTKMKSVSFSETAQLRYTIAHQDLSDEECLNSWFAPEEYAKILESCSKQVRKLENGTRFKDKKYCARGLETHTKVRSISKMHNRAMSIEAVLEEQDRQRVLLAALAKRGVSNDDDDDDDNNASIIAIAHVYRAVSASCQVWANTVGLDDQREAENILDCFLATSIVVPINEEQDEKGSMSPVPVAEEIPRGGTSSSTSSSPPMTRILRQQGHDPPRPAMRIYADNEISMIAGRQDHCHAGKEEDAFILEDITAPPSPSPLVSSADDLDDDRRPILRMTSFSATAA